MISKLHGWCNSIHKQIILMSHFCLGNQKPTAQTVKSDSQSNDSYELVLLINWQRIKNSGITGSNRSH